VFRRGCHSRSSASRCPNCAATGGAR
jgi:hypothetical protein